MNRSAIRNQELLFHLAVFIFVILFFIYPMYSIIRYSFLRAGPEIPVNQWQFVGLRNYRMVAIEGDLGSAIYKTIVYAVVGSVVSMILAILFALLVNSFAPGFRKIINSILIIPMLILPVAAGIAWSFFLSEHYGWFNFFISKLGFKTKPWLMTRHSLWFVILTDIWGWTPWCYIILLAGLQQVSPLILDAASIDGATGLNRFRYVIFPLIKRVFLIVFTLKLIDTYKAFDYLWVMTGGGPGRASTTLNIAAYKQLMYYRDLGTASAYGAISIIFPIVATLILLAFTARQD